MLYLGVNPCIEGMNYHDPSVALVSGNEILFAAEEERFNRIKSSPGRFPRQALGFALSNFVCERPYELVVPFSPDERRKRSVAEVRGELRRTGLWELLGARDDPNAAYLNLGSIIAKSAKSLLDYQEVHQFWSRPGAIKTALLQQFDNQHLPSDIRFVEHHLAHAAGSYLQSPFEKAVGVVVDGVGEFASTSIWLCEERALRCLARREFPNSIGYFYAAVTAFLGFAPWRDEGKTMALAPYGRAETEIRERLSRAFVVDGRFDFSTLVERCCGRGLSLDVSAARQEIARLTGIAPRDTSAEIDPTYKDVAAAAQEILEYELLSLTQEAVGLSGIRDVCVSGGVFYNCKANGVIRRCADADALFIQPVCGDAGTALGAALFRSWIEEGHRPRDLNSLALGRAPAPTAARQQLEEWRVPFREEREPDRFLAARIASGDIVLYFNGAAEFGPRALGQRSILADPRHSAIAERVNRTIKHREQWRPFGPAIAVEYADDILEGIDFRTPPFFMVEAYRVRDSWRERIPGVVHVADGSARPQLVSAASNPQLYAVLKRFDAITGVPVLLNTSLNGKGEPLIDDLADAIRLFNTSGADVLAIDNIMLTKN